MAADRANYVERRRVPWWWWAVSLLVAVPSVEVVAVYAPDAVSHRGWLAVAVAFAATVAVVSAVLLALSRSEIRADGQELWVDGESLPAFAVGQVRVLNPDQARRVLGRDADVAARLSIKPWLHRAVQIEVADPNDPTPYWVVASRRPEQLAAALRGIRGSGSPAQPPTASRLDASAIGDEADQSDGGAKRPAGRVGAEYTGGEKGQQ